MLFALLLSLLLSACASKSKPPPESILKYNQTMSAECRSLGLPTVGSFPTYPAAAARVVQEGWVILGYDVEAGRLADVRVIGSSPPGMFDQAVIDSVATQFYASGTSAKACRQQFIFKLQP
jgi:TonB family protein